LPDEGFDGVLVAHPVAAGDGVVGVFVETVLGEGHPRRAALGRHGVTAHRVHLGDHGDAEPGVGLCDGDGRAQTRAAAAHQYDVWGGGPGRTSGVRAPGPAGFRGPRAPHYCPATSSSTRTAPSWRVTFRHTLPSWYS